MKAPSPENHGPDLRDGVAWPYSPVTYAARLLWMLVWYSVWRICWKRVPALRCGILRLFGAKLPLDCHIAGNAWVEMPWNLEMGSRCSLGPRVQIYNLGRVHLGDQVVVSRESVLCSGTHDIDNLAYPLVTKEIRVGSFTWIAWGAFVLPGVAIGEGSVVAARSVVARDVAPWSVVAGNPARKIREREIRGEDESTK